MSSFPQSHLPGQGGSASSFPQSHLSGGGAFFLSLICLEEDL